MGAQRGAHRDAVYHFTDWVQKTAPCDFAPMFAKPSHAHGVPARMRFLVVKPETPAEQLADANALFDGAGRNGEFAGILWPQVRTPAELLAAVTLLLESDRWSCERLPWGDTHARPQDVLLSLRWRTASDEFSSVMGFIPHGSMPVPRRAPYAALVWWPGPRDKRFARRADSSVGFIDGEHRLPEPAYEAALKDSEARTLKALEYAPEDFRRFRKVAFCLPREDVLPVLHRLERRRRTLPELLWGVRSVLSK